jgi:predicted metalloprotease
MRWRDMRQSGNIEDRRGASRGGFGMGGLGGGGFGGGGIRMGGGMGLGGLVIVILIAWLFGANPLSLLSPDSGGIPSEQVTPGLSPNADEASQMVARVLGDTEDAWTATFRSEGIAYPAPVLVLFNDEVASACGSASSATGPFYCPRDRKVYIDLSFFRDLARRFGAPGDFAQAYVVAHEVGHHVQNTLGVLSSGAGLSRVQANAQSVQQELQADCLAGMWGNSAGGRNFLEAGDVEEGLRAAAAIGDDRIQRQTQGRVVPESFTHGSSAERVAAVRRGLQSTSLAGCGLRPR